MADRFLGLRCRPGDLAVIVQDEPECQGNIGHLVRVIKESDEFPDELGFHWEIVPLSSQPSAVLISSYRDKCLNREVIYDNGPRAHLDAWLRPLLDESDDEEIDELQEALTTDKVLAARTT
jgi:hypothetical protein